VRIEPELVNAVVAGQSFPEESGDSSDALGKFVEWRLGCPRRTGRARGAPVLIDFADDGGELFSRRTAVWIRE
jgi:hypothetical protein